LVLPESLPKERRRPFDLSRAHPLGALRAFRENKTVLGLAVIALFWQLAFQVYPSTWAFYTMAKFDFTPSTIGGTLALSGISMALVQSFVTGRVVSKLGEERTAPIGVAVGAAAFLLYAFITEAWMLIPLLAFGGLQGIAMPSINAMMSKSLGPSRQGELSGGMASIMGLAAIVGPIAMTQALSHFTAPDASPYFPGAAFVLAATFALTSLTLLLGRLRRGAVASVAVTETTEAAKEPKQASAE
jgi:DHA1 family tetracycline resistance protein-like MFS transporter